MHNMLKWANNTNLQIVSALCIAALVGTLAFFIQQQGIVPAFFYPLLFPLIVGGVAGALAGGLTVAGGRRSGSRAGLFALAVACGAVVFAVETFWAYRTYTASAKAALEQNPLGRMVQAADAEAFRPASPWRFIAVQMERSGGWWIIDGLLICAAAVAAALVVTSLIRPQLGDQPSGDMP